MKFELYRLLPSFEEYVLISQNRYRVEVFRKTSDNTWTLSTYEREQAVVPIHGLEIELPLSEIYAKLPPFPAPFE